MNDERLLKDLARVAREDREEQRQRLDERWDRLSHNALSVDEEAELRALAEGSDEMRDAYEAFRPLDADFRERVLHAVLAPQPAAEAEERAATVLPFRRRFVQVGGWLAAAAVLALVVTRLGGPVEPLPEYLLEVGGGDRQIRSEDPEAAEERVFAQGSRLELVLRPRTAVSGPVEASLFVDRGGKLRPWDVDAEVSSTGAVKVAGVLGRDLELEPGDWAVWIAVGRRGSLPDRERLVELLADLEPPVEGDWLLLRTRIRVVD
jgi:hypothetical protein